MFKRLLKKVFHNPYHIARKHNIRISDTILTKQFDITKYEDGSKQPVTIGEKCILGCNLIFESSSGQIDIGNHTYIGNGTSLISTCGIEIGNHVTISWGVTIYDHDSHSIDYRERMKDQERQLQDWSTGNFVKTKDWSVVRKEKIRIKDHAWIGFDVVILKGVTIGTGAVVGARSVVAKDVEPWTIVAGNPARVIRRIEGVFTDG
jgi:galactoside O-acetyltransferase